MSAADRVRMVRSTWGSQHAVVSAPATKPSASMARSRISSWQSAVILRSDEKVAQPRRLAAADAVLDPGVGAVTRLQRRQIGVSLVGDEHLKAKPVVIGEGELSAGMGPLTPADGPGGGGPGRSEEIVQLADGGTVPWIAVLGDRG